MKLIHASTNEERFIADCSINDENFVQALTLRDCLTSLGGDPDFNPVDYIEIPPQHLDNSEFLNNTCFYGFNKIYDQNRTEAQNDACAPSDFGYLYPSFCENNDSNSRLECNSLNQGCGYTNFDGFFCKGIDIILKDR